MTRVVVVGRARVLESVGHPWAPGGKGLGNQGERDRRRVGGRGPDEDGLRVDKTPESGERGCSAQLGRRRGLVGEVVVLGERWFARVTSDPVSATRNAFLVGGFLTRGDARLDRFSCFRLCLPVDRFSTRIILFRPGGETTLCDRGRACLLTLFHSVFLSLAVCVRLPQCA